MAYDVVVEAAEADLIAAVPAKVRIGEVSQAWKPALDQVWAFLKVNRAVHPGHNLFLYYHPRKRGEPMDVEFGVQVDCWFAPAGDVRCVETPAGEVATTIHAGPYDRLVDAHAAIHGWCAANGRTIGRASWEIYGDWNADPALLLTTVKYLLD